MVTFKIGIRLLHIKNNPEERCWIITNGQVTLNLFISLQEAGVVHSNFHAVFLFNWVFTGYFFTKYDTSRPLIFSLKKLNPVTVESCVKEFVLKTMQLCQQFKNAGKNVSYSAIKSRIKAEELLHVKPFNNLEGL